VGKAAALDQLCRLLQGKPLAGPDWPAILEVANLALITPRLERCLSSPAPPTVSTFVREVGQRNRARNALLYRQMGEAAAALNGVGLIPTVFKGGACLARTGGDCPRLISDIDLAIAPAVIDLALCALTDAGFSLITRHETTRHHAVAALGRAQDPGQIDLHQRPPGPASLVCDPAFLLAGSIAQIGPGRVRVPDPHIHIYLQALHDQLQDGGYWRGGFDLRHAWDIADLICAPVGVDWSQLDRLAPTRLTAKALAVQLMACHRLTGAAIPSPARRWPVRLSVWRQWMQYVTPGLRTPLAAAAILASSAHLLHHRGHTRLGQADAGLPAQRASVSASLKRLQEILAAEIGGRL